MRTVTTTTILYHYNELSEDAQEKACDKLWDINVGHEWWDFIYEDAARVGIKITPFYIGYCQKITADIPDPHASCRAILREHGKDCDSYKTARNQLQDYAHREWRWYKANRDDYEDLRPYEFREHYTGDYEDWSDETKRALREDYLTILTNEYEHYTSKEAIADTIEANDYDFTEDGTLA